LLLLLLCSRSHLLTESHDRDLETRNSTNTDVQNKEEDQNSDATHKDAYRMSIQYNASTFDEIWLTWAQKAVLFKQSNVSHCVIRTGCNVAVEVALQVDVHGVLELVR